MPFPKLSLFPDASKVNGEGHLEIGGCDAVGLAAQFGTPVYVFDEQTLRNRCAEFRKEFGTRHPDARVIYASKAFLNRALAAILKEEGLGLDVVSGGELSIAQSASFPMQHVYFHGNNKGADELALALDWRVGHIVVDNLDELSLLDKLSGDVGVVQNILLRISPGVDPHTHHHISTGTIGSKFGFPIVTGQAEEAVSRVMDASNLHLVGLHFHIGSSIFEVEPYREAIKVTLKFAAEMRDKYDFVLEQFGTGGGFAISYTQDSQAPPISLYAEAIVSELMGSSKECSLPLPQLVVEPGRAIVGQAGVALYSVGGQKEIAGVCRYVFVDGGMSDNLRPVLYDAKYEAIVASRVEAEESDTVTIAGKFCESGDILIKDARLAKVKAGDLLAIPACGAYCLPLASNYNASLRPAVVLVNEGHARLIRRRETYEDLTKCDLL